MSLYKATREEFYNYLSTIKMNNDVTYQRVDKEDWYQIDNVVVAKVVTNYNRTRSYWMRK